MKRKLYDFDEKRARCQLSNVDPYASELILDLFLELKADIRLARD